MRRRALIAALGGTAVIWPRHGRPQGGIPVVGFLTSAPAEQVTDLLAAFHSGLKEGGFVEGQSVAMDYR
jgi:putative tryptophan/tyrosine transport system substrate-binding protein